MNAVKHISQLPFVERTYKSCAPLSYITAPNIRDDGYISHREWEPLKSLSLVQTQRLSKPDEVRQRNLK